MAKLKEWIPPLKEMIMRNEDKIKWGIVSLLFILAVLAFFGILDSFMPDEKYKVQRIYSFDNVNKKFVSWGCQSFKYGNLYYSIERINGFDPEYPLYFNIIFESKGAFMPNKKIKVNVDMNLIRKNSSDLKEIKKIIIFFPGSVNSNSDNKNDIGFDDAHNIVLDIPTENNIEDGINVKGSSEIYYGVSGDYQPFYMILQGENNKTPYTIDSKEIILKCPIDSEKNEIDLSTCEEKVIDCPLLKIEPHSVARQIENNNRILALTLVIIIFTILPFFRNQKRGGE